ncbi:MAG: M48 family metallopeptidase [Cyanobacteria bacterium P01_H01_bin.74]
MKKNALILSAKFYHFLTERRTVKHVNRGWVLGLLSVVLLAFLGDGRLVAQAQNMPYTPGYGRYYKPYSRFNTPKVKKSASNPVQPLKKKAVASQPQNKTYLAQAVYTGQVSKSIQPEVILSSLMRANNIPSDEVKGIAVQNSNTLNAATDGQSIVITSGLLNNLRTADERAFVISHELSHILLNHIGKTQRRQVGLSLLNRYVLSRFTNQSQILDLASQLGIGLVDKRSSRTLEYQADDLGVRLMRTAAYNPKAALRVFEILKAASPNNGTPEFLQSHPISDSRVRALVQKYQL